MDIDIRQSGNTCVLKLKGSFKSEAVREYEAVVEGALAEGHIWVILDMEEMPTIDSSGVGAVVNTLRRSRQFGGDAKLVNPSPFAAKTFKMVGILSLFAVYGTQQEAVEACSGH